MHGLRPVVAVLLVLVAASSANATQSQPAPGESNTKPPLARGKLHLFFDTTGADFTAWVNQFKNEVYRNWIMPQAALDGTKAQVEIEFTVKRDGSLSKCRILSGHQGLSEGAKSALVKGQFLPLPEDYRPNKVTIRGTFSYNEPLTPPARPRVDGLLTGVGQQMGPLFFDPMGADFAVWINQFKNEVYRNWIMPQAALMGMRGHEDIEFTVERDGSLSQCRLLTSTGNPALDRAGKTSLDASRFLPLPSDYGPKSVTMRASFFYNEGPATGPK